MFDTQLSMTLALHVVVMLFVYFKFRDVFHPLLFMCPMALLLYYYMPYTLHQSQDLYNFISSEQAEFVHTVVLLTLGALFAGCLVGSFTEPAQTPRPPINAKKLQVGAIILGMVGMGCWVFMIRASGGIGAVFGQAYGAGWSDIGYIRDAVYLLLVAILLLLSPDSFPKLGVVEKAFTVLFAVPWVLQAILGARRGPTFVIIITLAMSWYMARRKRPNVVLLAGAGLAVGFLMLFLVTNRSRIYLGTEAEEFDTNITGIVEDASAHNEYIFGAGCIVASDQKEKFYWGKRYMAQVVVRPIPRQIWPTKYEDFGVGELLQNAGVSTGIEEVLGWAEIPGAAGGFVADIWVEFSWLCVPFAFSLGLLYGVVWKRAVVLGGYANILYIILMVLSVYLITQSMEAVIFRLVILSVPSWWVWRAASA